MDSPQQHYLELSIPGRNLVIKEKSIYTVLIALYLILTVSFSLAPIFEGPDELEHYRYIRTLVTTGWLPEPTGQERGQFHQAPLYYLVNAPLLALTNPTDADFYAVEEDLRNPFYSAFFWIQGNDNKNIYLHPAEQDFPYLQSRLAFSVHLLRLISIGFGLLTLLTVIRMAPLLWPEKPHFRLMLVSFVALQPQFLYTNSVITNDNLLILLSTLSLYIMLQQVIEGPTRKRAIWLGVALGCVLITKLSALFLVFPAAVMTLSSKRQWKYAAMTLGAVALVGGWWFLYNTVTYNDPALLHAHYHTWATEQISPDGPVLKEGIKRIPFAYQTFWARFGGGPVAVSRSLYTVFDGITFISLSGCLLLLINRLRHRFEEPGRERIIGWIILTIYGLAWVGALTWQASSAWSGNQGRYLLPAIVIWGILFALGFQAWFPNKVRTHLTLISMALFAVVTFTVVYRYFLPSYQPERAPSQIAIPGDLVYEDTVKLIGWSDEAIIADPGEVVTIRLYWSALAETDHLLQSYIHTSTGLIKRDSYTGMGNLLSVDWVSGQQWTETFHLQIPDWADRQNVHHLIAGIFDEENDHDFVAMTDGGSVQPIIGVLIIPGEPSGDAPDSRYIFADHFGLADPEFQTTEEGGLEICLSWIVIDSWEVDLTTFVHLIDDQNQLITQVDYRPHFDRYPTWAWQAGEVVRDCVTMMPEEDLQPDWQIKVGMYDPSTGERISVVDQSSTPQPENSASFALP